MVHFQRYWLLQLVNLACKESLAVNASCLNAAEATVLQAGSNKPGADKPGLIWVCG